MTNAVLMVSGKFLSMKNDGTPNAQGAVYFFEPGLATPKVTYSNSALSIPNNHPIILDAAGRAAIYFSGNADITVKDSAGTTLYTQANTNPSEVTSTVNYTTATALTAASNGKWITTTADITLPAAITAGTGWQVFIKNLAATPINIIRASSGDTLNNALANLALPPNESVSVLVNNGVTGYDIFLNAILEISNALSGQVLSYTATGPAWQTVDLINAGNDLYLYSNFT